MDDAVTTAAWTDDEAEALAIQLAKALALALAVAAAGGKGCKKNKKNENKILIRQQVNRLLIRWKYKLMIEIHDIIHHELQVKDKQQALQLKQLED